MSNVYWIGKDFFRQKMIYVIRVVECSGNDMGLVNVYVSKEKFMEVVRELKLIKGEPNARGEVFYKKIKEDDSSIAE